MVNSHNVLRRGRQLPTQQYASGQYDRDTFIEASGMRLLEF